MIFFLQQLLRQRLRNMPFSAGGFRSTSDQAAQNTPSSSGASRTLPYLGLSARLSQTWINKWTILLLLVLARMILAIIGLNYDIASARREALSACTTVENVGSAMASMPHYLAQGVNELTASGVEKAVRGLMDMLSLTVTGVEEVVVFYINMLTSTYLCLITLVVTGSLHVAVDLVEDITGFLNKTLGAIGNDIQNGINDFEGDLNSIISKVDNVLKDIGTSITIPTLNVNTSIAALHNLQLPSGLNSELQQLNNDIPTFAEVNNLTQTALRWPFEEVKKLIVEHGSNYTFDRSAFPVPETQSLTFCSDNNEIQSFFDGIVEVTVIGRKVAIAVLLMLAILACGPMAYREIRGWRIQKERSQLISSGNYDTMDVVYIVSRPYTATAGIKLADGFKSRRRQALIRWTVAYATTIPALFVLALGVAGLFSCLCQFLLLKAIAKEVPSLENEITGFADKVVSALNNASEHWANGTNTAILDTQTRINTDLFSWVNTSSHALNNTLNTFVDESIKVLNFTFGNTILYDPVTQLFNCLIGLKIAGIEKGLTWVSDHAYIDFPLLPNNTFSLGASQSVGGSATTASFLTDPQSGATDAISTSVTRLQAKLQSAVLNETYISCAVIAVWGVIVLLGFLRALTLWFGTDHDDDNPPRQPFAGDVPLRDNPFSDDKRARPAATGFAPKTGENRSGYDTGRSSDESDFDRGAALQYRGTSTVLKPIPYAASQSSLPPYNAHGYINTGSARYPPPPPVPPKPLVPVEENVGFAGARTVGSAVKRQTQFRTSSHVVLGDVHAGGERGVGAAF